jgi:pyruvate formate lyase activating enzyme
VRIGGLTPFTLSDFPGRAAAVVFAQGCNFRCPYCHNGALLPDAPGRLPETEVLAWLDRRRGRLGGVVVSGGEPTLQADLPQFCAALKARGFAVKLDTNGSRPGVLRDLLRGGLLDYVAMDVKAPPASYHRLAGVPVVWTALAESIEVLAASRIPHHFRTTVVPALVSDADLRAIRALLPAASRHVSQPCRLDLAREPGVCGADRVATTTLDGV